MSNADPEMARRPRGRRDQEELGETDYKPINWKRFFFTPKYIRALVPPCFDRYSIFGRRLLAANGLFPLFQARANAI